MSIQHWSRILPMLLVLVAGCSKPQSQTSRIAFLREHLEAFNSYVARVERDEVAHDESGYALPTLFAENGIKQVARRGDCVEITLWFMATDEVPLYIYSPRGLQGVPDEYRTGGLNGRKRSYWKLVPVDDKWFYCEWDQ